MVSSSLGSTLGRELTVKNNNYNLSLSKFEKCNSDIKSDDLEQSIKNKTSHTDD